MTIFLLPMINNEREPESSLLIFCDRSRLKFFDEIYQINNEIPAPKVAPATFGAGISNICKKCL